MDSTALPKSRAEAKAIGAKYYFTGEPCKHGHIAPRKAKGACVECLKVEWEKGNLARTDYFRQYNEKEEVKDKKHDWYLKNRELVLQAAAMRPAHVKRIYQRNWRLKNDLWVKADTKARRRKHRQATPKWLTRQQKQQIRELYKIAITMTKLTGERYVVDHIVPLRSDIVCGLHVPWNLRVITQLENLQKSNKIVDTQPPT
jgi:hypothetical protein